MMIQKRVLVAEDDPVTAGILRAILGSAGFEVTVADNGKQALDVFLNSPFPVIVTDIAMPQLTGQELIENIKAHGYEPVIIVQTAVDEVHSVIEIMKQGVFDYVLKPLNQQEFLHKIENAFEIAELRQVEKALERERELRTEQQLSNRNTIEKILTRDYDKFDKELFTNLKTSFSQGSGFGGLLALISLISVQAKKEGGKYIIDKELMDLVIQNAQMGQRALEAFSEIESILNEQFDLQPYTVAEFSTIINRELQNIEPLMQIKNTVIKFGDNSASLSNKKVNIDQKKFLQALRELFINAMKFSIEKSSILLLLNLTSKSLMISVLNKPIPGNNNVMGIPSEYARIIFEPFFRLTRIVDERFGTLEFGLGLTMVEKIIRKHRGKIIAGNIIDHLDIGQKGSIRVNFEIELPLSE